MFFFPTVFLIGALVFDKVAVGARPKSHDMNFDSDPELHIRMDPTQSVMMLGRHNFNVTIAQEHVDNWIVLFCVDWYEHCQGLWHDYRRMAMHWEKAMAPNASSWHNSAVRFAEVDCAVDKALCNENDVEGYPSAVHFRGGRFAKEWVISRGAKSLQGDLSKWIGNELKRSLANRTLANTLPPVNVYEDAVAACTELSGLMSWKEPAKAAIGHFCLFAALACVVWVLGTGLELEVKTALSLLQDAKKQMPILPELKEMPAPRTIVRSSMVL